MSLNLEIWRADDYLLVEVSGEYSMFGFKELTKRMRLEAQEQKLHHLMIDLTRILADTLHLAHGCNNTICILIQDTRIVLITMKKLICIQFQITTNF